MLEPEVIDEICGTTHPLLLTLSMEEQRLGSIYSTRNVSRYILS